MLMYKVTGVKANEYRVSLQIIIHGCPFSIKTGYIGNMGSSMDQG